MSTARQTFHASFRAAMKMAEVNNRKLAELVAARQPSRGARTKSEWEKQISDWRRDTVPRDLATFLPVWSILVERMGGVFAPAWDKLIPAALAEPKAQNRARSSTPRPRQLPPDLASFVGREDTLASLDTFTAGGREGNSAHVVLISGMAGVGKTALAVKWAHNQAEKFPDGHIHLNLRGYASERSASVAEAMGSVLAALGVEPAAVPLDEDARRGWLRTLLSTGRYLFLFDNVAAAQQISGLIPANPECLVIITSREELPSLPDLPGRIQLKPLLASEAQELMRRIAGQALASRPGTASELVDLCGLLPLAIWIVGRRLRIAGSEALDHALAGLRDEARRIHTLSQGKDDRVEVAFNWSYDELNRQDSAAASLFGKLAASPGPDYRLEAVAALADQESTVVQDLLDRLVECHLAERIGQRYRQHDLLRLYARRKLEKNADHAAISKRALEWYLGAAAQAQLYLTPDRDTKGQDFPDTRGLTFDTAAAALALLEEERRNFVAVTARAAHSGLIDLTADLQTWTVVFYHQRHHLDEWIQSHEIALEALRATGDAGRELGLSFNLADAYRKSRRFEEAEQLFRRALELTRRIEPNRVPQVHYQLGNLLEDKRQFEDAKNHFISAINGFQAVGQPMGVALAQVSLGDDYRELGRFTDAERLLRGALSELQVDPHGRMLASWALAVLLQETGRPQEAAREAGLSLDLARATFQTEGEGSALLTLALAERDSGELELALGRFAEAERFFTTHADEYRRAVVIGEWARALQLAGAIGPAHQRAQQSIDLLATWDDAQARHVADGLGRARDAWPSPPPTDPI